MAVHQPKPIWSQPSTVEAKKNLRRANKRNQPHSKLRNPTSPRPPFLAEFCCTIRDGFAVTEGLDILQVLLTEELCVHAAAWEEIDNRGQWHAVLR